MDFDDKFACTFPFAGKFVVVTGVLVIKIFFVSMNKKQEKERKVVMRILIETWEKREKERENSKIRREKEEENYTGV